MFEPGTIKARDEQAADGRGSRVGRCAAYPVLLFPFFLVGPLGCANFWDDVTSRDFKLKELFVKPDPMEVLAHSTDGDKQARALRALREPKQYGGSDAEQDRVVTLLVNTAVGDRRPLCRLAAIQALGRFHDPRAVQGLIDAYYAVTEQRLDPSGITGAYVPAGKRTELVSTFSPEMVSRIQCQALMALGQTGNPRAVELLTTVVREPQPEGQGRQQAMEVRLAAVRALAKFQHYQATEALVHVLRTEKDVALRDAAHESLQAATGQKLPPDARAWERLLHPGSGGAIAGAGPSGPHQTVGFVEGGNNSPGPQPGQGPTPVPPGP